MLGVVNKLVVCIDELFEVICDALFRVSTKLIFEKSRTQLVCADILALCDLLG